MSVNVEAVARTLRVLLLQSGCPVMIDDDATGERHSVDLESATSPMGLLPVFVTAGEAVWREATGKGFGLDVARDAEAFLGFRLRGIGAGSFSTVMLATFHATAQITADNMIVINDFNHWWEGASERVRSLQRLAMLIAPASAS
jgi:hypothetical protein